MRRLMNPRVFRRLVAIVLPLVACLELFIAYSQYRFAERQEYVESLMFAREYINGYVYVYTVAEPEGVELIVERIRDAELPALAVPSQYEQGRWLIIAPSFGEFQNIDEARNRILGWRWSLESKWCWEARNTAPGDRSYSEKIAGVRFQVLAEMQARSEEIRDSAERCRYRDFRGRQADWFGRSGHVTYYKADITTWKPYFRDLAQSEKFYVDVGDAGRYQREKAKDLVLTHSPAD